MLISVVLIQAEINNFVTNKIQLSMIRETLLHISVIFISMFMERYYYYYYYYYYYLYI
jgi:hypothetical protein